MHPALAFTALVATFITSSSALPAPQAPAQFDGLNINTCPQTTADRKALFQSKGASVQGMSSLIDHSVSFADCFFVSDLAITIQET